jgi:uncharacterized coiled-coil protein SlyX
LKKAQYKKRPGYITMKIIRGTGENAKTIRFPRILAGLIFGFLAVFVIYVSVMTYMTRDLSFTYQNRLEDITELETLNSDQKQEISTLNTITAEVREKLEALKDIETKVKELVGIDKKE